MPGEYNLTVLVDSETAIDVQSSLPHFPQIQQINNLNTSPFPQIQKYLIKLNNLYKFLI